MSSIARVYTRVNSFAAPVSTRYGGDGRGEGRIVVGAQCAHFEGLSAERFARAMVSEGIPCSGRRTPLLYRHPVFTEQRFFFEEPKRIDYTQVYCPVAEAARGQSIGFPQTVLLGDDADLDDIIEAAAKVRDNVEELL